MAFLHTLTFSTNINIMQLKYFYELLKLKIMEHYYRLVKKYLSFLESLIIIKIEHRKKNRNEHFAQINYYSKSILKGINMITCSVIAHKHVHVWKTRIHSDLLLDIKLVTRLFLHSGSVISQVHRKPQKRHSFKIWEFHRSTNLKYGVMMGTNISEEQVINQKTATYSCIAIKTPNPVQQRNG
jgi:hypothetical protein